MGESDKKLYTDVLFYKDETNKNKIKRENTLSRAWEIRNFEIGLYWKRALYFWGFIALSFAAYIAKGTEQYSLLIACSGFIFSFAWFLVNKASKFWQENWEAHIDCLEDELEGRLYKTVMKNKASLFNPLKGYHFSVSKINQLTNVFVIFIWVGLILKDMSLYDFSSLSSRDWSISDFLLFITITVLILGYFCKTSFAKDGTCIQSLTDCKYKYFNRDIEDD